MQQPAAKRTAIDEQAPAIDDEAASLDEISDLDDTMPLPTLERLLEEGDLPLPSAPGANPGVTSALLVQLIELSETANRHLERIAALLEAQSQATLPHHETAKTPTERTAD